MPCFVYRGKEKASKVSTYKFVYQKALIPIFDVFIPLFRLQDFKGYFVPKTLIDLNADLKEFKIKV